MSKNDFMKDLKNNVKPIRLTFEEIEMIEDEIDKVEEFMAKQKENLSIEQKIKNKQLIESGFKNRIRKILGYECNLSFNELLKIKNRIIQFKNKYNFDEMSEEEKVNFEQSVLDILYGSNGDNKNEVEFEVDKIDKIEHKII